MMDFKIIQIGKTSYFIHNILKLITGNTIVAVNIHNIIIPTIIAIVSYLVMKNLGIQNLICICGSIVYAFLPFYFLRMYCHFYLASYYLVPVSVMLCFWILEDDNFFKFEGFFKNRRNLLAMLFCFLIVNDGNGYYSFFTAIIIFITGISLAIKNKNIKNAFPAMNLLLTIIAFLSINLLPGFIYTSMHGDVLVGKRSPIESEFYGLKIIRLFLPLKIASYFPKHQRLIEWIQNQFCPGEGSEYLGIIGALGCAFLLIAILFKKKDDIIGKRITLCSELIVFLILISTISGLSLAFSIFVTPQYRGYNRISIFIAYISILSVCLILNEYLKKISKNKKQLVNIAFVIICVISIFESFPGNVPDYKACKDAFTNDKNFIMAIENKMPKHSMIYQLPYHQFPEVGPQNNMSDYTLMAGYIQSEKLKWSYGGMKGRKSDLWNQAISSLPVREMVDNICFADFNGIYIDRRGYTESECQQLESELSAILNISPIVSENKMLCFFDMSKYKEELKSNLGTEEFLQKQKEVLNIVKGGI